MNRILGNIYLSSIKPLEDGDLGNITHILSIIPGDLPDLSEYVHLQIPLNDNDNLIFPYLNKIFDFINVALFNETDPNIKSKHQGHLLIHCHEGLSRSVTILICYLIKYYRLSLDQAIYAIKRRQEIRINEDFMEQLKVYEDITGNMKDLKFRLYLSEKLGTEGYQMFNEINGFVQQQEELEEDTQKEEEEKEDGILTCKKCRHPLALSTQILPHQPPDETSNQANFMKKSRRTVYSSMKASSVCSHYYLKDPLKWMNLNFGDEGEMEGRLNCPNCNCKVGGYSWKGSRCSCGKWIIPAFDLSTSKVDFKTSKSIINISPELQTEIITKN
ncbi:tyrosine-protein phosphatase Yvh1p [[Candida] jaroonii]|uniref:Tyrosine-protein phosphatase Yvh1p n=1 Tax=[Candida] jaroonii TaxID=467808 RepID=A0ACA9YBL4_9ASCO|nr:tyrosine-protein phosphatase Yvh1p [[Candida] jaroonii]